jgi:hypothetical protein
VVVVVVVCGCGPEDVHGVGDRQEQRQRRRRSDVCELHPRHAEWWCRCDGFSIRVKDSKTYHTYINELGKPRFQGLGSSTPGPADRSLAQ